MGLFDFLKKADNNQQDTNFKTVIVDGVYMIEIPKDWNQFESDRFRTVDSTKKVNFVVTNYGKDLDPNKKFTVNELATETFDLFEKFVKEGDYIPNDDRLIGKNFVYQSFIVDDEVQYYYYTFREGQGMLIRTYFILKEIGDYKTETKDLLLKIGESIITKMA